GATMEATPAASLGNVQAIGKTNLSWPAPGTRKTQSPSHWGKSLGLCAHASQQIINLQGFNDVAEAACDAVVHSLSPGLWRFIGIKSENNRIVNSQRSI